nr:hypothetical protein [Tanacetum cinerariifolium]
MMRPDHQDPNTQDNMKLWKRYCFHKFTMSFCYGKDVTEMQSLVCVDDELQIKKIIKFRLGGRAHNLTLFEFARRLGLECFNVYFKGGLRNDVHFNVQDYWLSISREENLGLSQIHTSTIRNLILRVIHKMITYGLCQRTTGYDKIQKNDPWLLSLFDARHQNGVLTEDVVRSLSALIYCRDLDTITLRDLIDSIGKLILEDPRSGVPGVGIPMPPRASMQNLYNRMGRMEIRQEAIEQIYSSTMMSSVERTRVGIVTTIRTHYYEAGSSRSKRSREHETVEEVLLPQVHHEFLLWEGCNRDVKSRDVKSRYNTRLGQLLPRHIYSPCIINWDVLNRMGYDGEIDDMLRIILHEAGSDEEIFTSIA